MPDVRPRTPPLTPSQRERLAHMLEVWREVRQDVDIQALWDPLIAEVREGRASLPAIDELSWQLYEELSWQISQRFPVTLAYHGPLLAIFVMAYTHALAVGEWPAWTPWQAMRLAPDNSAVVGLPGGGFYVSEDATDIHIDQLKAYVRWSRATPRGRPPGTKDTSARQAPRRLDPELARRAYELDRQRTPGQSRLTIAQALGLPYDRQDPHAREAMRKRLERLIHHHELTLQKKSGREKF